MRRRLLLVAVLALSLVAPTAVPALQLDLTVAPGGTAEASFLASPNMEHLVNLPHKRVEADGSLVPVTSAQNGTDIEFVTIDEREFALAGSYQHGLQIVDITDPTDPVTVGLYDCGISQGDVQVFDRDGRIYVAYTADNGYGVRNSSACVLEAEALGLQERRGNKFGTYIADITEPTSPVTVSFYGNPQGSHNQTVAPGGLYLYNSNSDIGILDDREPDDQTGRIEVVDISDFANPTEVAIVPLITGADSHDITFNADGTRAYTAALTHTLVLDTTDLANPEVIGRIIDPTINIHHQSDPVTLTDPLTGAEHDFIVISDELAGAAGNGVCPGGGLHIYDVTGDLERTPVKVGYWNMPSVTPTVSGSLTCTSHVLRIHPDEAIMTIAWYHAGVRVVDISGLIGVSVGVAETVGNVGLGMQEIGFASFDNSDTWSAKTPRIEEDGSFYLFGNDMSRGLDVYRFQGDAPVAAEGGTWLTGAGLLTLPRAVTTAQATRCLLK